MRGGIVAAGDGSRFLEAGLATPKPLIQVGGQSLIERTLRSFMDGGIDECAFIVNEAMAQVVDAVMALRLPMNLRPLVKTTKSSMHSLYELGRLIGDEPFVLGTVDSVIRPSESRAFITRFQGGSQDLDLLLSYTDFVDDEKPLRIAVHPDQRVLALGDDAKDSPFVTVGLYGITPSVLPLLEDTMALGMKKLRNFLGAVLKGGARVKGFRLSKAIDVDRPHDLEVAEAFLKELEVTPCS